MTLGQSDVYELLDAIRAGGDIDMIRKGVELVLQALIDTEATERIGAARYERTATRTNQRTWPERSGIGKPVVGSIHQAMNSATQLPASGLQAART